MGRRCGGKGVIICAGNLKTFMELVVRFHCVRDTWVFDRTGLPSKEMTRATGKAIMNQVLQRVAPIQGYKVYELNQVSYDFVMKHNQLQQKERMHYQGHHVESIPVTEVVVYKGRKRRELVFRIFGNNRLVYFPDYPQKGCSCCC